MESKGKGDKQMSRVMMLADLHWGHKNAINWRTRFSTPEEHDEVILDNIMSSVTKRDTLWLLGDCFMDESSLEKLKEMSKSLKRIHLVLGNHDTDRVNRVNLMKRYFVMFDSIHGLYKHKGSWLSHAPIHPEELRGKFNIHGHVHENTLDDPRYFNVSCENVNYTPINYQDILGILKDRNV